MRLRITYLVLSIVLLFVGLFIFYNANQFPFIRNSVGDFLVVMLMYVGIKFLFPTIDSLKLVIGILIFSIGIEVLQLIGVPHYFGTDKTWVKMTLGSHFEWMDMVAYLLGIFSIYWIDHKWIKKPVKTT